MNRWKPEDCERMKRSIREIWEKYHPDPVKEVAWKELVESVQKSHKPTKEDQQ